jgi:hypothetical protein
MHRPRKLGVEYSGQSAAENGLDPEKTDPYCPPRLKAKGVEPLGSTSLADGGGTEAGRQRRVERTHRIDQSLPETVQVLRPPGTWTVPGAFLRPRPQGHPCGRSKWRRRESNPRPVMFRYERLRVCPVYLSLVSVPPADRVHRRPARNVFDPGRTRR